MEANSILPTPRVVAFVGPCRRVKKSGRPARPIDPIKTNATPTTNKKETTASLSIVKFLPV
jgi:hypothetical protein